MSTWSLEPPWEDVAIAYFFDQHVIEPKSGSLGHLEFLPALYLNSPTHSCLRPSLNAVANLSLYYSSKSPPLQFIARRLHHEALLSMNSALHDPGENCLDETLAAAMLLSLFEVCPPVFTLLPRPSNSPNRISMEPGQELATPTSREWCP